MFAAFNRLRKVLRPIAALVTAAALTACTTSTFQPLGGGGSGPEIDPSKPIRVALLVPHSDADSGTQTVARALENATRLAISEQRGARIELKVYDTAGQASRAAAQAQLAVDEGARIILGPLRADAVNAAGLAVADEGINVLGFSNNPSIAGGNVFILGNTFNNTAARLMKYAKRQGEKSVVILHANDVPGQFGRLAAEQAASRNGIRVVASQAYEFDEASISSAASAAAAAVRQGNADTVFLTAAATTGDFPRLMTLLPERGVNPAETQYINLAQLNVVSGTADYPASEGAWFAMPDSQQGAAFGARYQAAYGIPAHPLAALAYDGMSAVGSLASAGRGDALTARALTRSSGFNGVHGIFRLMADGTNQRALAIATLRNKQVVLLDPAPTTFGGAGF